MLLRRMMEHVTDQNWFAVALDFGIVVGGVLLAFQLQTLGEERAAAARAERSLHQLYEESETALNYWVEAVRRTDRRHERQDRVIGALVARDPGDLTEDEIASALGAMGRYPTLSPPRRVYDELSSAGLLREINAPDATAVLTEYYEQVAFIQGQIDFFRPSGRYTAQILDDRLTSEYDVTSPVRQRIVVDFDQLARDSEYLQVLIDEFRNAAVFQFYRRGVMRDAAAMCLALAEAIGQTCTGLAYYQEYQDLPEWQMRDVPPEEGES